MGTKLKGADHAGTEATTSEPASVPTSVPTSASTLVPASASETDASLWPVGWSVSTSSLPNAQANKG